MADGLVIQIGEAAADAAALVARARGWERETVDACARACAILERRVRGPVVVVALRADAGTDAMLQIAKVAAIGSPEASLGIVVGEDAEHLDALARRFDRMPRAGLAQDQPFSGGESTFRGARMVEPKDAEGLAFLTQPAEIAFVFGHSNGLDMDAGVATLCTKPDARPGDGGLKAFDCFRDGACARCRPGQPQASPKMLRMRRLVLVSCWGVTLSDAVFDPALSIGRGLADQPILEAFVTTVRAARVDELDVPHLYYLANRGYPLGAVANRANQERLARGLEADFLCFGDPESATATSTLAAQARRREEGWFDVAIDPSSRRTDVEIRVGETMPEEPIVLVDGPEGTSGVLARGTLCLTVPEETTAVRFCIVDRRTLANEARAEMARDLAFAQRYVRGVAPKIDAEIAAAPLASIDRALEALDVAAPTIGSVVSARALDESRAALARTIATTTHAVASVFAAAVERMGSVHPAHVWQPRYDFVEQRTAASCACGSTCDEHVHEERVGKDRRSLLVCRACGPVFDGDPSLGASLGPRAPLARGATHTIELPIASPYGCDTAATGVAMLSSFRRGEVASGEARSVIVPARARGILAVELTIPHDFPRGVSYLACALVIGGRLHFFRRAVHVG